MKHKTLCLILGLEAIICIVLAFLGSALPFAYTSIMAFPFEQLGQLLRHLSLSGGIDNVISIILYIALGLIPLLVLLLLYRRKRLHAEDSLLAVLSAQHFIILYLMINPGLLPTHLGAYSGMGFGSALLGNIYYSVLVGYVVLRMLRSFSAADTGRTQKYLSRLLCAVNILFVYLAFGAHFNGLLSSFEALRAGNTGSLRELGATGFFLVLQYVVNALPYILDVIVLLGAMTLLLELGNDRYSEQSVQAAERLARLCRRTLVIIVLSNVAFNLLQLAFVKSLAVVNSSVQIPILSITLVLAALLLAQYIRENKRLKDDNDMFI